MTPPKTPEQRASELLNTAKNYGAGSVLAKACAAAIRAAVEAEREEWGVACAPLIAAVDAYEKASAAREHLGAYGIRVEQAGRDLARALRKKMETP